MQTQLVWASYLRAIATIAVIMLHVSAPILYKFQELPISVWNIGNFYDGLTRFCVPIFFMISGAFLLGKDYTLKKFISKRFLKIIPPFLFWSLIYIVYDILDSNIIFESVIEFVKYIVRNLFYGSSYHLWFVYTISGLYLIIPIIRKWIKKSSNNEILYFLGIWLVTFLYAIPKLKNYLPQIYLINFIGYLGFMVLGYYLLQLKAFKIYKLALLFILGFWVTVLGTYCLSSASGEFQSYFYDYFTFNVLLSSIGMFLIFKQIKIKSRRIDSILMTISNYSFGIYLVHVLVIQLLEKIGLDWSFINPIFSIPILTVIVTSISTLTIFLAKKINFYNMIMLGKLLDYGYLKSKSK